MKVFVVLFAILLSINVQSSNADIITYNFSGIGQISDPNNLVGGSASNMAFTGSFAYDTNVSLNYVITYPNPDTPNWEGTWAGTSGFQMPGKLSVSIGGLDISADDQFNYFVKDLKPTNPDVFGMLSHSPVLSGGEGGTGDNSYFGIYFYDISGSLFSDTSIPISINLSDYSGAYFQLGLSNDNGGWGAYGNITKLWSPATSPVPEPISMLLFGTGIVGVGAYVSRKFKH